MDAQRIDELNIPIKDGEMDPNSEEGQRILRGYHERSLQRQKELRKLIADIDQENLQNANK